MFSWKPNHKRAGSITNTLCRWKSFITKIEKIVFGNREKKRKIIEEENKVFGMYVDT